MTITHPRLRQLVDWRSAIYAGLIAGLVFYILNLVLVPVSLGGSPSLVIRYIASVFRGDVVLPVALPEGNTSLFGEFMVSLLVNFAVAIFWALLIAYIVHRGGLLTGIVGGALLGVIIYVIDFYGVSVLISRAWIDALAGWSFFLTHLIFGAVVGGVYEALEEEIYAPAQ